ncbi:unnamed protein product [Choristocarpus tenellus]
MKHIHANGVKHGDVKSPNILLDGNRRAKVADFGLAQVVKITKSSKLEEAGGGSAPWAAPEVLDCNQNSRASDVYSFGIVLWEILTLEKPWDGKEVEAIWCQVCLKEQRPPLPTASSTNSRFKKIISKCWAQDRRDRPTFEVLEDQASVYPLKRSHLLLVACLTYYSRGIPNPDDFKGRNNFSHPFDSCSILC